MVYKNYEEQEHSETHQNIYINNECIRQYPQQLLTFKMQKQNGTKIIDNSSIRNEYCDQGQIMLELFMRRKDLQSSMKS